ncbi:MAG TPA: BadF/BadG/BcrA/BcrD ATPase family protein [Solirubrobacteraceae bacterium]|jgi:N-acetylglucosamine kinase-like BadF-type ATPase
MNRDSLVQLPGALAPAQANGSTTARFIMGIDGGATKTLAAVLDLQSGTLHLGHGGPSNQDAVGVHAATNALLEAADEAIGQAGAEREGLDGAVLAVAGTDTDAVEAQVRMHCPKSWIVVNDVVGAWATATAAQPGVGVISGTGSNVFGVGSDGRAWRAGGWGHVLGDEGSGYWFGLQSIRAALADRESSGPPTALSDAAVEFFGAPSVEALAPLLYTKPLSKSEIAALAVETARLAQGGDQVARAIYEDGAARLCAQIAAVIQQTGLSGAFPIGLIGSAFKAGEVFIGPLIRAIHALAPEALIAPVEMAPVGGCVLLAARACGADRAVDQAQLERLIDAALWR